MKDLSILPDNLPVPVDDGACDHLLGMSIPAVSIASTAGKTINLGDLDGVAVFYFFPMLGNPNALKLPTFNYENKKLIKRLAIISVDAVIKKVFYPVFPPNRNAEEVLEWIVNL